MIVDEGQWLNKGDRLVVFGDSISEASDGYMVELTRVLEGKGIEVVNGSTGGANTCKALMCFERDVLAHEPTAISFALGTNDANVGRGKWVDEPMIPVDAYAANLNWMIFMARGAGVDKFSVMPSAYRCEGDEYLMFADARSEYRLAARQVAEDNRARFVPVDVAFENEWRKHDDLRDLLLTSDGVHLNKKGNAIVVRETLRAWGLE